MNDMLIATMGLSPGVVTSAYHLLAREGYGYMGHVISVTTAGPAAGQCEQLVWQQLEAANPQVQYEPQKAIAAQELYNTKMANRFSQYMEKLLREHAPRYRLHLVLSGGRTSMAAATMLAVQKLTFYQPQMAKRLRLYHVEVLDPEFDERGTISRLAAMTPAEQSFYLDPPADKVQLIQVPILTLAREPKHLWARLFEFATGDYLLEQEAYEQLRYSFQPAYLQGDGLGEVDIYAERRREGSTAPPVEIDRQALRGLLAQAFNLSELKTLCFDLNIEYEDLSGGLSDKIRELVRHVERHWRTEELIAACQQQRPRYTWNDALRRRQVVLCECKLRTGEDADAKPIGEDVVGRLARKVTAVREETNREVVGWVVTNSRYAGQMAMELAQESGIELYHAALPHNWKERADWRIRQKLEPLLVAPNE